MYPSVKSKLSFVLLSEQGRRALAETVAPRVHLADGHFRKSPKLLHVALIHACMRRSFLILALATVAYAGIVEDVRGLLSSGSLSQAEAHLKSYRVQKGATPEYLEAYSWLARTALSAGSLDRAEKTARQTEQLSLLQLKARKLDAEQHLPIALGAAIEVEAQVLAARGQRAEAVVLLERKLRIYRDTSIRARLQKNLNLLSLEGKPAPRLELNEHLGPNPAPLAKLKGYPMLLFFWAHWCGDCKAEGPILARLKSEYGGKGLILLAPTKRYGYAARGEDATPSAELSYIEQVRQEYYRPLLDVPAPVSQENFNQYGASTTPTLVLVDRAGKVSFYHPGFLPYEQLKAAIDQTLAR